MKIYRDIQQGTQAWSDIRVGIITASNFERIIQPKKWLMSAGQWKYMHQMLAELAYGHAFDTYQSPAMETGTANELESLDNYCYQNDCNVEKVGFVTNDAGTIGCSPDGLVVHGGVWLRGVEAKNPEPKRHSEYLGNPQLLIDEYFAQVQCSLLVCELDKWDLFSYDMKQPFVQVEIGRNEEFLKEAERWCNEFLERFSVEKQKRGLPDRIIRDPT